MTLLLISSCVMVACPDGLALGNQQWVCPKAPTCSVTVNAKDGKKRKRHLLEEPPPGSDHKRKEERLVHSNKFKATVTKSLQIDGAVSTSQAICSREVTSNNACNRFVQIILLAMACDLRSLIMAFINISINHHD